MQEHDGETSVHNSLELPNVEKIVVNAYLEGMTTVQKVEPRLARGTDGRQPQEYGQPVISFLH